MVLKDAHESKASGTKPSRGSDWDRTLAEHKERVRTAIGQAAVQIAAEQGLAGTTMAKIAERAGVSRATVYNHFRDVEHVLLEVVQEEVNRFYANLSERIAEAVGPQARLEAFLLAHLEYFAQPQRRSGALQLQALGISPAVRTRMTAHTDRLRALLTEVLEAGRAEGVFSAGTNPRRHAELVMHLLSGAREQLLRGDAPVAEIAADLMLLTRCGLGQPAGGAAARE
ncbi:TetR/AcrR family transcriptional regulator [Streptomyces sp. SAJ15]|uniref:TetR/AcrR family transcriptional regulator n=1 Tax=Streptomyces sp. SAJ15 TaxID=2011095 RepID=UPI0016428FA7|nr:TetR/AcrR family transcriptional regulator [Streptomyces sp. SAJ15]